MTKFTAKIKEGRNGSVSQEAVMSSLTAERVRLLFDYDAATGNFLWRVAESKRVKIGDIAGTVASNGRRYVGIDHKRHLVHRLVWLWHKGSESSEDLSPIDGDYLNTRIENLKEQTKQETVLKGGMRSNNTSGVKGVWFDAARKKWAVQTVRNYRTKFHGRFDTLAEAEAALASAVHDEATVDGEKQTFKRGNVHQRRMWNTMIRSCGGRHTWPSMADFIASVGNPPKPNFYIAPKDTAQLLGPTNFVWSPPQYDCRTRDGRNAAIRSYRDNDPDKYRDRHLRREFGISLADYDAILEEQGGVCAICAQPETAIRQGRVLPLAVDHNHRTGAPRGLLCTACNIGIGSLAESEERLDAAKAYLQKWKAREAVVLPDNVVPLKRD